MQGCCAGPAGFGRSAEVPSPSVRLWYECGCVWSTLAATWLDDCPAIARDGSERERALFSSFMRARAEPMPPFWPAMARFSEKRIIFARSWSIRLCFLPCRRNPARSRDTRTRFSAAAWRSWRVACRHREAHPCASNASSAAGRPRAAPWSGVRCRRDNRRHKAASRGGSSGAAFLAAQRHFIAQQFNQFSRAARTGRLLPDQRAQMRDAMTARQPLHPDQHQRDRSVHGCRAGAGFGSRVTPRRQPWREGGRAPFRCGAGAAGQLKMQRAVAGTPPARMPAEGDGFGLFVAAVRVATIDGLKFGQRQMARIDLDTTKLDGLLAFENRHDPSGL